MQKHWDVFARFLLYPFPVPVPVDTKNENFPSAIYFSPKLLASSRFACMILMWLKGQFTQQPLLHTLRRLAET